MQTLSSYINQLPTLMILLSPVADPCLPFLLYSANEAKKTVPLVFNIDVAFCPSSSQLGDGRVADLHRILFLSELHPAGLCFLDKTTVHGGKPALLFCLLWIHNTQLQTYELPWLPGRLLLCRHIGLGQTAAACRLCWGGTPCQPIEKSVIVLSPRRLAFRTRKMGLSAFWQGSPKKVIAPVWCS